MEYKISAFNILEYGQRKDAEGNPHQEDSLFPAYGRLRKSDRLFIVCDGMGGHDSGEVASATVCEVMSKAIIGKTTGTAFTDEILNNAVESAFDALDAKDTGAAKKMGTTMVLLQLHQDGATIAHIGDSRVYHIRPGKDAEATRILHVTKDHSLLNNLLDIGELTEEDIPHFSQKNVITRAMQPHQDRRSHADIYHTADIQPGDYFYLCTDGMLENTTDDHIRFIFSEAIPDGKKKDTLIKVTNENKDNHSAIVVRILAVAGVSETPESTAHRPIMAIVDEDGHTGTGTDGKEDTHLPGSIDSGDINGEEAKSEATHKDNNTEKSVTEGKDAEKTEGSTEAKPKAEATTQHTEKKRGICQTKSNTPVQSRGRSTITPAQNNKRHVIGIIITIIIAVIIAFLWVSLSHGTVETQIKPDL